MASSLEFSEAELFDLTAARRLKPGRRLKWMEVQELMQIVTTDRLEIYVKECAGIDLRKCRFGLYPVYVTEFMRNEGVRLQLRYKSDRFFDKGHVERGLKTLYLTSINGIKKVPVIVKDYTVILKGEYKTLEPLDFGEAYLAAGTSVYHLDSANSDRRLYTICQLEYDWVYNPHYYPSQIIPTRRLRLYSLISKIDNLKLSSGYNQFMRHHCTGYLDHYDPKALVNLLSAADGPYKYDGWITELKGNLVICLLPKALQDCTQTMIEDPSSPPFTKGLMLTLGKDVELPPMAKFLNPLPHILDTKAIFSQCYVAKLANVLQR